MANEFGSLLVGGQCFFNEQTAFALMVICVDICTTRYLHLDLKTYSFDLANFWIKIGFTK